MRNNNDQLNNVAPLSIIAPIIQEHRINDFVLEEEANLVFKDDIEKIYYITHKINNTKHKNGRINIRIDKEGQLFANSVSPYADKYMENIEEKIQPLVLALHKKRYLTYSSCEGHGMTFRRYVGLAFADEESREYVAKEIECLKIFGVFVKKFESVANQKIDQDKKGRPIFVKKYNKEDREELQKIQKEEVNTFNIQFHRHYENYYFLEIIILEEVNINILTPLKSIKLLYIGFLKKFFWEKITQKVVNHINHVNFKKYPY